jgi:hypothetical protein
MAGIMVSSLDFCPRPKSEAVSAFDPLQPRREGLGLFGAQKMRHFPQIPESAVRVRAGNFFDMKRAAGPMWRQR